MNGIACEEWAESACGWELWCNDNKDDCEDKSMMWWWYWRCWCWWSDEDDVDAPHRGW
jgi:hypothetical protein